MKKIILVLYVFVSLFSVWAETGFRWGHGAIFDKPDGSAGLTVLAGADFGLSKRLELNFEVLTEAAPSPFADIKAGFELSFSLLGDRVRYDGYAGSALNSLVSLGLFAGKRNPEGLFLPSYLTLRITPVTAGTVMSGKRECFLPVGVAWNFREHTVSLFISAIVYDCYFTGTWRDL